MPRILEKQRGAAVLRNTGMEPRYRLKDRSIDPGTELLIRFAYGEVSPSEEIMVKRWTAEDEFAALALDGVLAYRAEHRLGCSADHLQLLETEIRSIPHD